VYVRRPLQPKFQLPNKFGSQEIKFRYFVYHFVWENFFNYKNFLDFNPSHWIKFGDVIDDFEMFAAPLAAVRVPLEYQGLHGRRLPSDDHFSFAALLLAAAYMSMKTRNFLNLVNERNPSPASSNNTWGIDTQHTHWGFFFHWEAIYSKIIIYCLLAQICIIFRLRYTFEIHQNRM